MVRISQIDQLVESGLCSTKKLPYARIVLSDVRTGITNMVYRDLAILIFGKIANYVLNDQIMYQRLRQLLLQNSPSKRQLEEIILDNVLEIGTDSYRKVAQGVTPGQGDIKKVQPESNTLKTIKKVIKK